MINAKNRGFTLIELLVVVAIIGLLASIVVVALGTARQGGRDTRAIADLRQIQTAMELSYDAAGPPNTYPDIDNTWQEIEDSAVGNIGSFLNPVPTSTGLKKYFWCDNNSPTDTYKLAVELETGEVGGLSGNWIYISNGGTAAKTTGIAVGGACAVPAS